MISVSGSVAYSLKLLGEALRLVSAAGDNGEYLAAPETLVSIIIFIIFVV